jgi:dihydrolipoamide dehydrogenase
MAENYDLVVLGAGPGGYVAAIRAAQLGMKVAVVEKEKVGGICLHKGCIPSKTLLRSAELYHQMKEGESYGIQVGEVKLDLSLVQKRKNRIVDTLHKGVQTLLKKNGVDVYEGYGRILGPSIFSPMPGTISVEKADGSDTEMLVPRFVLIATGSRPRTLPGLEFDGTHILSSDHALELEKLPKSMIIIGGGVIGIEWASMLNDFGVEVTVVEYADRILPFEDEEISKEMTRLLKKRKVNIVTGAKVLSEATKIENGQVVIQAEKGGETLSFTAEKVLVSVGRQANIEDIGLQNTSIKVERGAIQVNEYMQTAESHIYAIGDVVARPFRLAHVASHEGILAVEHMNGLHVHPIDPLTIPRCTYSRPEVGSIGLTESEAKEKGFDVKVGKFPVRALGKALVFGEIDGFIKIVSDAKTDDLLGVHIIGPHATDLISEAGLAKVLDATAWEISQYIHPHPTLSEMYGEAALQVDGKAIHI